MSETPETRLVRWRWAVGILISAAVALVFIWLSDASRQDHVIQSMVTGMVTLILLFVWAVLFSRFRGKTRLAILCTGVIIGGGLASSLEIKGVSGDLVPIFRWRWNKARTVTVARSTGAGVAKANVSFPQFLGPDRDGVMHGITLETNWTAHPPQEIWRHELGEAWTGFVVADGIAVTQEQRAEQEVVTAYELETGKQL